MHRPDDPPTPAAAEDVDALLARVDARLRWWSAARTADPRAEDAGATPLDPVTVLADTGLDALAAPRFHPGKGGTVVRLAKAVLNVPLGVLGRPQAHFNVAVRQVLGAWATALSATLAEAADLEREVTAQRDRLASLEARVAALEREGRKA